jgi:hypothetical protein
MLTVENTRNSRVEMVAGLLELGQFREDPEPIFLAVCQKLR